MLNTPHTIRLESMSSPTINDQVLLGRSEGSQELVRVIPIVAIHTSGPVTTLMASKGQGTTSCLRNAWGWRRYKTATSRKGKIKEKAHTSSKLAPITAENSPGRFAGSPRTVMNGTRK